MIFDLHHIHLPHFSIDTSKNLRKLYGVRILHDLSTQLVFFFFPIYLFEMGKNGTQLFQHIPYQLTSLQQGFVFIALFYALSRLTTLLFAIPLGAYISTIGLQKGMMYGYLFRILQFGALLYSVFNPWAIFAAAVIDGLYTILFWNSYLTYLSQSAHKKNMGKDLGFLQICMQLLAAVSPAVGGALAYSFGYDALFMLAISLSIGVFLIMTTMESKRQQDTLSIQEFIAWMKEKRFEQAALSFAGRYINDVTLFIWPLYVYLILGTVARVGYLYTVSLFMAFMVTLFVGMYIDNSKSRRPFMFSGGVISLLWLARTQVFSVWGIALVDAVTRLTSNFHWLFFDMILLRRGKGRQALSYFMYREVIRSVTALVFWITFGVFFVVYDSWNGLFILAAAAVLLSLYMKDIKPAKV